MLKRLEKTIRTNPQSILAGIGVVLATLTIVGLIIFAFGRVLFITVFLGAGLSGDPHLVFWGNVFLGLLLGVPTALYFVVLGAFHISYKDRYPVFVSALWYSTVSIISFSIIAYGCTLLWNYLVLHPNVFPY